MRNRRYRAGLLPLAIALLLTLAACGGSGGVEATTTTAEITTEITEASTLPVDAGEATGPSEETSAPGESAATGTETTTEAAAEAAAVPATPSEVLAAYTAVMNKAKNEAKQFRKLEYQQLGKETLFELDVINTPTVMDWLNGNAMTTREKAMTEEKYTAGVTDMTEHLPVHKTSVGCMVKDPGVFTRATARQLSNGNIELTLIMKPEDNPEPALPGATTAPSRTGEMFGPLSKAGIDDLVSKGRIFITTPLVFQLRYFDCKATLVYNPETDQIVSMRQDYNVRITITQGRILWAFNPVGYATLEAVMVCDQFRY